MKYEGVEAVEEAEGIVQKLIELVTTGDESATEGLAIRFREALKRANPDLGAAELQVYDRAYALELPRIRQALREARCTAAAALLAPNDLDLVRQVISAPEIVDFFALLRRLGPALAQAAHDVVAREGVAAHQRGAEAVFEALAEEAVIDG